MPLLPGKKNVGPNIETEMKNHPRAQAIAIALDVLRRGRQSKADGGGILDALASNPHGWGAGPEVSSFVPSVANPLWKSRALASATDALAARDAIGEPDVDLPISIGCSIAGQG